MILKTEGELERDLLKFKQFLAGASGLKFWQTHFQNHNFSYEPDKFNWDYWDRLPFFTKEDFFKVGFHIRHEDVQPAINEDNIYNFILGVTSGTSGVTGPVLLLRRTLQQENLGDGNRVLCCFESFTRSLNETISGLGEDRRSRAQKRQVLTFSPYSLRLGMEKALADFSGDAACANPAGFVNVINFLSGSPEILSSLKKIKLSGDFIGEAHLNIIRRLYPEVDIISHYGMAEVSSVSKVPFCYHLRERRGLNAYHPISREALVELVDLDENGYGEVVITKLAPLETATLRYRTGDIAQVLKEPCLCGSEFTLFLIGRKDFDFIKCAGALVVRQELERVLDKFRGEVADWGAEVRELQKDSGLTGELTLRVKPTPAFLSRGLAHESFLAKAISAELFLTPTDTLAELAAAGKFEPLKVKLTAEFPPEKKPIRIRKVKG